MVTGSRGGGSTAAFASLSIGMSLLYVGGMYLNDYCDAGFDAKYRPERPIPAGDVGRKTVLLATLGQFAVGFLLIAWLRVETAAGRAALGARASVRFGEREVQRSVRSGYSYGAACDAAVHVGLGAAERVDEVRVRWCDGTEERFGPFEVDRSVVLRRGQGS